MCYNPPSASVCQFTSNLDIVLSNAVNRYDKICLLGDFNLPGIEWGDVPQSKNKECSMFCEILDNYGLVQLNNTPSTKHGNILDLVISNCPESVTQIDKCDIEFPSDHVILNILR